MHAQGTTADTPSPELVQPPVCSAYTAARGELEGICEVTPLEGGGNRVKINLTAQTAPIEVGGYRVITENYNGAYLTPIVEALPGDTVAARLVNLLAPRPTPHSEAHGNGNPTNLHYFHGGIVTPRNARHEVENGDARKGTGDNIYVYLTNGLDEHGKPRSFEFDVPIPGDGELDARVLELEKEGYIAHPNGLNWYHSHLHGISSDQVMGGLSGLLSTGDAKANVKAACRKRADTSLDCSGVDKDTAELKDRTIVRYALLRDISLKQIGALPVSANGESAVWAPEQRDFPQKDCWVWETPGGARNGDAKLRKGYCQRDEESAWLFTLNGQRFPTITVEGGRNLLLRLGNLSANVAYWLELSNEQDETKPVPLTLLSIDGVVPSRPVDVTRSQRPLAAISFDDFLFMPASRAEIYVRNDCKEDKPRVYILRTKGLIAGRDNATNDRWPKIQLARIVLKPSEVDCAADPGLNAPLAKGGPTGAKLMAAAAETVTIPDGCVEDLDPASFEHRRVTFLDFGETSDGRTTQWSIATEIVRPPAGSSQSSEADFKPAREKTVGTYDEDGNVVGIPFEEYELQDGAIDWLGQKQKHVCVFLDPGGKSHKQLWVLVNRTGALHNFHIHQMKFRLATTAELIKHKLKPPASAKACEGVPPNCTGPEYDLYDDQMHADKSQIMWHDTIPVPPQQRVFLIMSFDAPQQLGRFVYHCHILKHEDNGLMAPLEVWGPTRAGTFQ